MVAPYERAFHGWFGPEGVPSSRTGARGLLVRSSLLLQSAHRLVPMRHDMVGDGRWGDAARFQAKPTQWFDHELMCSAALPARGAIPAMNFRTLRHRGSMPDKRAFVREGLPEDSGQAGQKSRLAYRRCCCKMSAPVP